MKLEKLRQSLRELARASKRPKTTRKRRKKVRFAIRHFEGVGGDVAIKSVKSVKCVKCRKAFTPPSEGYIPSCCAKCATYW